AWNQSLVRAFVLCSRSHFLRSDLSPKGPVMDNGSECTIHHVDLCHRSDLLTAPLAHRCLLTTSARRAALRSPQALLPHYSQVPPELRAWYWITRCHHRSSGPPPFAGTLAMRSRFSA